MIDVIHELLKNASEYTLADMHINPRLNEARLNLSSIPTKPDLSIELYEIAFYKISKTPEDEDGCFVIGDLCISELEDRGLEILKKLGYGILDPNKNPKCLEDKAYYLHIDGDIVCDIVCGSLKVFKQV